MLQLIFFISIFFLFLGYKFYGSFLGTLFKIDNTHKTPAYTKNDGRDYVPTKLSILFGHNFSSIAGAGPIVGPIIAGMYFGWLPVLVWIIIGSIFVGGLHDFSTLIMSIRNDGKSIAEIIKTKVGKNIYFLLLFLILITLQYVLIVFLDLTATTFAVDGTVASASTCYIFLALILGFIIYKVNKKVFLISLPFIILLFVILYYSSLHPFPSFQIFNLSGKQTWQILLLVYCFIASVLPVWILLQPRDYLSSYMLYFALFVGFVGILFTKNLDINYKLFVPFVERGSDDLKIFPALFILVACGAVSGFHSLVSSGTTAKQISKETDAKIIGYGGMLLEGALGVIALVTIMTISKTEASSLSTPLAIFSNGMARFLRLFGVEHSLGNSLGNSLGLLVISTFLLTTLDTATRICRYIFQELLDVYTKKSIYYSTLIVLVMPFIFIFLKSIDSSGNIIPAWRVIWPIFGTSNQLLACAGLLTVLVWIYDSISLPKKIVIILPMLFMFTTTWTSFSDRIFGQSLMILKITSIVLVGISIIFIFFASKYMFRTTKLVKIR
ncbi:carbon starvation protein A [bacterium]